ncbi:MAG: hypothetical protein N2167_01305 [Flavobacteriales bacterium]|nr:hypothetical protein [Flavobacteriales bacterium]
MRYMDLRYRIFILLNTAFSFSLFSQQTTIQTDAKELKKFKSRVLIHTDHGYFLELKEVFRLILGLPMFEMANMITLSL